MSARSTSCWRIRRSADPGRQDGDAPLFILYAIPVGLLIGTLAGGRLAGLGQVRFRWAPLALLALAVQAVLFSSLGRNVDASLIPPIYTVSTAAVLVVVLRNLAIRGLPIVALGAAANLAAIVANGGFMPADAGALAAAGLTLGEGPTNSIVVERPALGPLTDVYALPAAVPLANIFSVGDVLIGVGVAIAIATAMRSASRSEAPASALAGDGRPLSGDGLRPAGGTVGEGSPPTD